MAEKVKEETPATPVEEERQEEAPPAKPRRRTRTAPPPVEDDDPVIDLDERVGALEEAAMSRKTRTAEPEESNQWPWILAAFVTLAVLLLATKFRDRIASLTGSRPASSSPPPVAP